MATKKDKKRIPIHRYFYALGLLITFCISIFTWHNQLSADRKNTELVIKQKLDECWDLFAGKECYKKNYLPRNRGFDSSDLEKIKRNVEYVLKLDKDNHRAIHYLALYYHYDKDYNKSSELCENLLKISPYNVKALNVLCLNYFKLGNLDEAIKTCRESIKQDSMYPGTYYNIGIIHALSNEMDSAWKYIDKTIEIDNSYSIAYHAKAVLHFYDYDHRTAIETLLQNIRVNPEDVNSYIALIYLYYYRGEYLNAKEYLKKGFLIDKENALLIWCHGLILIVTSNEEEAMQELKYALRKEETLLDEFLRDTQLYIDTQLKDKKINRDLVNRDIFVLEKTKPLANYIYYDDSYTVRFDSLLFELRQFLSTNP